MILYVLELWRGTNPIYDPEAIVVDSPEQAGWRLWQEQRAIGPRVRGVLHRVDLTQQTVEARPIPMLTLTVPA